MQLKSFFAESVEAALGLAREEHGSDAMLVNSRPAPAEARHLGAYEVVAARLPGDTSASGAPPPSPANARDELLVRELAGLRRQMERMRRAVWRFGGSAAARGGAISPERAEALAVLAEADVDAQLAHEIAACVEARLAGDPLLETAGGHGSGAPGLRRCLAEEIGRRFLVDARLQGSEPAARAVVLVGPPGAGKTTTLAKLACFGGLRQRRRTRILSLDTYRIGSAEPLRTYASLLGLPLQNLPTGQALAPALGESGGGDLVLVDTPGFGPRDMDAATELADAFRSISGLDVHLILPATMRSADLTEVVERFEVLRPGKLLLTRVDETFSLGAAFSEAARTGKPLSFLAMGQQVPDDLEEADAGRVIDLVLGRQTG
jgi:flagellar biosynthesis protein FlhF